MLSSHFIGKEMETLSLHQNTGGRGAGEGTISRQQVGFGVSNRTKRPFATKTHTGPGHTDGQGARVGRARRVLQISGLGFPPSPCSRLNARRREKGRDLCRVLPHPTVREEAFPQVALQPPLCAFFSPPAGVTGGNSKLLKDINEAPQPPPPAALPVSPIHT